MTSTPTPDELDAIAARAAAATAGPWNEDYPWWWQDHGSDPDPCGLVSAGDARDPVCIAPPIADRVTASDDDIRFIAHARTDVPRLLAALAAAVARADAAEARADSAYEQGKQVGRLNGTARREAAEAERDALRAERDQMGEPTVEWAVTNSEGGVVFRYAGPRAEQDARIVARERGRPEPLQRTVYRGPWVPVVSGDGKDGGDGAS